jgi:DNA-binding beta-propeller fold protein YncE
MATACDEYGAAPLPNGVDCGVLGQCCLYGGCVPPQEEVCDGVDNNCNGTVDEGVLSQCGDCNPKCGEALAGPDGDLPFVPTPDNAWGMEVDDSGSLLVKLGQPLPEHVWIANSEENTISKLSTATGQETGRYTTCANPSRTAVDLHGNVWVACRNDGGVAKIAGSTAFCKDKNADGLLQTSADANGDGKISAQEMLPAGSDECIRFIVYPGGSCQRSLGVDKQNFAWVGEWYSMTLRRLSPDNGATVKSVVLPANPYGLVIDGSGIVWISGRGGYKLVRYDPATGAIETYVSTLAAFEPYGITLDSLGRVWVANCCSAHVAHRFDPITKAWALATVSARPRGIAGSITGQVWVANDESNKVTVVDAASAQTLGAVDLGLGHFPIGVGLDFGGFVWTVNQASSSASKIDPAQMKVVGEYPVGKGPYTYSDFSGYILYNFTAPVNQAYYTAQFGDPLGAAVTWKQLSVDFDQDGEDCATLEVLGRIGDTVQALAGSAWTTLSSGPLPQELDLDLLDFALHSKLMEAKLVIYLKKDTCTIKITGATVQFVAD